jgi:broad specificity phosphatase PhoE
VTDPPLSSLGHRQALETAEYLQRTTSTNKIDVDAILVSPYLRAIQTAYPTSEALKNAGIGCDTTTNVEPSPHLPLLIEDGLSESHATGMECMPSPIERFTYFPTVDPEYESLLRIRPNDDDATSTTTSVCRRTGMPCESFPSGYVRRMERFASALENAYAGKTIILFSHAASLALVAALTRCSLRDMKFAPCGIYELVRHVDDVNGPWTLASDGGCNATHVTENSSTTYPWGFTDRDFEREENAGGIDMDYFVERRIAERDERSKT